MRRSTFFLLIMALALQAFCDTISIQGYVRTDFNEPLSNTSVQLLSKNIYDTTNFLGLFSFHVSRINSTWSNVSMLNNSRINITTDRLVVDARSQMAFGFSIYNLLGKQSLSNRTHSVGPGKSYFPLPDHGANMSIIGIITDHGKYYDTYLANKTLYMNNQNTTHMKKVHAIYPDSLYITHAGFRDTIVYTNTYNDSIIVKLGYTWLLNDSLENILGINILQYLLKDSLQRPILAMPTSAQGYVDSILAKMSSLRDERKVNAFFKYSVTIIKSDSIELATALPGGQIFLTSGLLNNLRNEAEIAAVLARFISHISRRQGIQALVSSISMGIINGAIAGDTNALRAICSNAMYEHYSRNAGIIADSISTECLIHSNYNPRGISFLYTADTLGNLLRNRFEIYASRVPTGDSTVVRIINRYPPSILNDSLLFKNRYINFLSSINQ